MPGPGGTGRKNRAMHTYAAMPETGLISTDEQVYVAIIADNRKPFSNRASYHGNPKSFR